MNENSSHSWNFAGLQTQLTSFKLYEIGENLKLFIAIYKEEKEMPRMPAPM
jgi:hypothetical protein